jgi:DNA (cytosine-5)-methyltransferase 1
MMISLELFAGAGGLGLGLHAAGFRPIGVVEKDADCCEALKQNAAHGAVAMRGWKVVDDDVRHLDFRVFEDTLDLVSGGPPCQPFSLGGKHAAYDDARDMFPQAVRAVREARPAAFIFENVKGLTRERFQNYFEYIRLQLTHPEMVRLDLEDWIEHLARLQRLHTSGRREGLHYRVITQVLNAADFGVPQRRERVFFVGFQERLGVRWSFPDPTHSREALLWDQSSNGTYWDRHRISRSSRFYSQQDELLQSKLPMGPRIRPWRTIRDVISNLPAPATGRNQSEVSFHRFQPGARVYPGHTGSKIDEPAKALKAGVHGVPGGENMLVHLNGTVRYFTLREAARLQTFPDDFIFTSSWSESMRQLGNAVPVDLANVVGRSVMAELLKFGCKDVIQ